MAIATKTQYWTSRMKGGDPTSLSGTFNESFSVTGSGASASGGNWAVTDARYSITPDVGAYTMVACFTYPPGDPNSGEVLMALDNGTHRVEVQATGNIQTLNLVGTTTVATPYLDIQQLGDRPVPPVLRLTLDTDGSARLYMHEIIHDDDGEVHYKSVTGKASTSREIAWGNNSGTVNWSSVYVSKFGAFGPDELLLSDFAQDTLARMGLGIVEQLKNSTRPYLKTQVDDSSIIYGYDLSSEMTNRLHTPTIHVLISALNSPTFESLGGAKITQNYDVQIYVATRGTNYENSYRSGLNILGEVFDELYTQTGVQGTTDSIIQYDAQLDSKMDDDETVCVHILTMTYMRRIDMRHR